ncbi:MAG: hypothetical protein KAG18_08120, partial [Sinobacterium sp.]|nr:hypothetical protein [Sinobacterium sp.]
MNILCNTKSSRLAVLSIFSFLSPSFAMADTPEISVSGFATFAYAKAIDEDRQSYISGYEDAQKKQPTYAQISGLDKVNESGEYRDFNKFGIRLTADLEHNLVLGAQLIANGKDDYEPVFDWLYVQYDFTPNVSLKLGRTTLPLFMYSDFLDTTYAYQWISAPYAVYGPGAVKTNEGFMLDWKASLGGGWTSLLSVFGGKVDEAVPGFNSNFVLKNGLGLAWDIEYEWLRLRVVRYQGKSAVETVGPMFAAAVNKGIAVTNAGILADADQIELGGDTATANHMRAVVASNQEDYDDSFTSYSAMAWEDSTAAYTGFGLGLDFEAVFFNAEVTRVDVEDTAALGVLDSWYAMIGYRLPGDVSIAFTYSENKDDTPSYDYDELITELSAVYRDDILGDPALNTAYQDGINLTAESIEQSINIRRYENVDTYTLSGRWDFHPSSSLKVEYLIQNSHTLDFNG